MEALFAPYFDYSQTMPGCLLDSRRGEVSKKLLEQKIFFAIHDQVDKQLAAVFFSFFENLIGAGDRELSYETFQYFKTVAESFLAKKNVLTTSCIREILYFYNYNETQFVTYEMERLQALCEPLATMPEKIALLQYEQKLINQLPASVNTGYKKKELPLQEQVNGWINEEISYLEKKAATRDPGKLLSPDEKIQTSLSVAKLAVLLKLLVADKIIINRNIAPALRTIARTFTTLQTEEMSFGSLETKYHAPEKTIVTNVRDMLFKWIKVIDKL
jgi:hypothetical protein